VPGIRHLYVQGNSLSFTPRRVLFLCTGNSARSILAEAVLNSRGAGRFAAQSAGSHPVGAVNPLAIATLRRMGLATEGLYSKRWDTFAAQGEPPIDLVITVCDKAAAETCPMWPGHPMVVHWGLPDPAAVGDDAARAEAFRDTYAALGRRIDRFLELPFEDLDRETLRERITALGAD
jgi:protein-tyrosine-phosphatase